MTSRDIRLMSDAEILAKSAEKPQYFEELVNRYQRQFTRKAVSILRNEEDANDAVQEAFVRMYVSAKKFKEQEGASFSSWAYTVLVNQCYTLYKKRERRASFSLDVEPEYAEVIADESGLEAFESKWSMDHVMGLVSKLPLLLRRVVVAHFIEGLPQKVIAIREGVSHGVVRTRIHRAKKELQKLNLEFAYVIQSNKYRND